MRRVTAPPAAVPSFPCFLQDYRWSHGPLGALNSAARGGAEIGEGSRVGLALANRIGDDAMTGAWSGARRC